MSECKTVTLRTRPLKKGMLSFYLDYYPGYRDQETMKTFRGKIPCTVCRITDAGRDAFAEYVEALQSYIKK